MPATVHEHLRSELVAFCQKVLWSDQGADHLTYLRDKRRLSDEEIIRLNFGYCPLTAHSELVENKLPDISGRLIMPLYDSYGELLVLTTRDVMGQSVSTLPLHWHESFVKSDSLYGFHVAKKDILAKRAVVVVEGQFDVAYLRSIGIKHVVGMLGHSVCYRQLSLMARYCSNIYLFFDGDQAGRDATRKTMKLSYDQRLPQMGIEMIPIDTPWGKDPDEFSFSEVINLCKHAQSSILRN